MISLPPSVRIFVAAEPTDLRKSFDSLAVLTKEILGQDPLSGHLFVFFNKRLNRTKILLWDRTGYLLIYKRIEEGMFHLPTSDSAVVEMASSDLMLLLEGIDLAGARRRKRFELERRIRKVQ